MGRVTEKLVKAKALALEDILSQMDEIRIRLNRTSQLLRDNAYTQDEATILKMKTLWRCQRTLFNLLEDHRLLYERVKKSWDDPMIIHRLEIDEVLNFTWTPSH